MCVNKQHDFDMKVNLSCVHKEFHKTHSVAIYCYFFDKFIRVPIQQWCPVLSLPAGVFAKKQTRARTHARTQAHAFCDNIWPLSFYKMSMLNIRNFEIH